MTQRSDVGTNRLHQVTRSAVELETPSDKIAVKSADSTKSDAVAKSWQVLKNHPLIISAAVIVLVVGMCWTVASILVKEVIDPLALQIEQSRYHVQSLPLLPRHRTSTQSTLLTPQTNGPAKRQSTRLVLKHQLGPATVTAAGSLRSPSITSRTSSF